MFTPNLPTNIVDFRGLDSSIILISRGGILMSRGDSPESLSQAMSVGTMLVGRLGVYYYLDGHCEDLILRATVVWVWSQNNKMLHVTMVRYHSIVCYVTVHYFRCIIFNITLIVINMIYNNML